MDKNEISKIPELTPEAAEALERVDSLRTKILTVGLEGLDDNERKALELLRGEVSNEPIVGIKKDIKETVKREANSSEDERKFELEDWEALNGKAREILEAAGIKDFSIVHGNLVVHYGPNNKNSMTFKFSPPTSGYVQATCEFDIPEVRAAFHYSRYSFYFDNAVTLKEQLLSFFELLKGFSVSGKDFAGKGMEILDTIKVRSRNIVGR